jgi:predicted AAA+ superfamily ATPase
MRSRTFWLNKIELYWQKRPIIWMSGVRRAGKTTLARSVPGVEYFDCESAATRYLFDDIEAILAKLKGKRIVIDEIHRLSNPAEVLKLAHDYYPETRVLATGSSTLGISDRFKDTLTGRKYELWLTPMNHRDLVDFANEEFSHRMLHGGLPPFFLASEIQEQDFEEWLDSFWSRDIQQLFRLQHRSAFLKLVELLFVQSGSIYEATRFAQPCEINRQTVNNYLAVLEHTHTVHVVRPFTSRKSSEIISAPKVYAFDTGFVSYFNAWSHLTRSNQGHLWEHLVLNELHSYFRPQQIQYWRNKQGNEIDFVLIKRGQPPIAVECKWRYRDFDISNLECFRRAYPQGENFVVASNIDKAFTKQFKNLTITFLGLQHIAQLT